MSSRRPFIVLLMLLGFIASHSAGADPTESTHKDAGRPALSGTDAVIEQQIERERSAEKELLAALATAVTIEAIEQPLRDVVDSLSEKLHVQIICDPKKDTVDTLAVVSFRAKDLPGRDVLDIALRSLKLDWTIHHGVVWISSEDEIATLMTARVYPVADLPDTDALIELIQSSIGPPTIWRDVNPDGGTIESFGSGQEAALVITQTLRCHERIAALLAELRRVRASTAPNGAPKSSAAPPTRKSLSPLYGAVWLSSDGDPELQAAVVANNAFACDLYAKLAATGGNLAFSPLSISTAMAMVYGGARNETATEIAAAMHFKSPQEQVHPAMAKLLRTIVPTQPTAGLQLTIANSFWCQEGHPFLDAFKKLLSETYSAEATSIDFGNMEATRRTINNRIAALTDQKIKEIIPADGLTKDARLILTNAIYFNGKWSSPFSDSRTRTQKFYGFEKDLDVPSMSLEDDTCRYANVDNLQILEKTYADGTLAMTILLPPKGAEPFAKLSTSLTPNNVSGWLSRLKQQKINVHLPKLKVAANVPLTDALKSLGIDKAFIPSAADLSGMDGSKMLYINAVYHRAYVDVDEAGTKAAAATAAGGYFGGTVSTSRLTFRADHPFIFLIRDTATGYILFMGQFVSPQS